MFFHLLEPHKEKKTILDRVLVGSRPANDGNSPRNNRDNQITLDWIHHHRQGGSRSQTFLKGDTNIVCINRSIGLHRDSSMDFIADHNLDRDEPADVDTGHSDEGFWDKLRTLVSSGVGFETRTDSSGNSVGGGNKRFPVVDVDQVLGTPLSSSVWWGYDRDTVVDRGVFGQFSSEDRHLAIGSKSPTGSVSDLVIRPPTNGLTRHSTGT